MKGRLKNNLINWLALVSNLTQGLFLLVCLGIPPALAATDCKQVNQISPPECNTLVALYKNTDGPNWNDSQTNNWNVTNEPCQWAGITCENEHVTQINREYVNLVGTLPDLSALTFLQSLDLGTNCGLRCGGWNNSQLTGTLPNLSALTQLTFLDLSGNKFSGTINISSLPSSLQELYLQYNQLEGPIPNFKEKLTKLTHLNLGGNSLTGPIDGLYFPPSLKLLSLYGTPLNQPLSDLSSLINLTDLDLGYTQLSGTIDANYFPKSLTTLYLDGNPFNQPIPNLSSLTHLTYLYLGNAQLSGSINVSFFPTSLQSLSLGSNPLEGNIPSFSALNNLHYLDLSYNPQLKGIIDASLFPLSLQNLSLNGTPLNQPIPNLSTLSNLNSLDLNGTQLTGTINSAYFPPNLTNLSLGGNQLHGSIPDFSKVTGLQNLSLSNNQLTGTIPDLTALSQLWSLDLSSNQLTGSIPNLPTSLGYLYLNNNQLSGSIPILPTSLYNLYLNNNQLSGPIPTLPTSLGNLYLNNNQLSGDIPLSFTKLTNICSQCPDKPELCQSCLDLSNNYLNTLAKPEVLAFLEAPGNKDPDWAKTQTFLLFKCPAGGSFGIKPDPNKFDFGTAVVNDQTTIILSTRSQDCGDFKVKGIEFVGTSKNEFAFTGDPQNDCYEGEWNAHHYSSCQFILTFTPKLAGVKDDLAFKLVFDPNMETPLISIKANAVASGSPEIKVTPPEHNFGEVSLGYNTNTQTFTLTNSGNVSLKSPAFAITGTHPLDFTFDSWSCDYKNVLLPNEQEQCDFMAQFIPRTAGDKQADLTITSSNVPDAKKIPLSGKAKTPEACDTGITNESLGNGNWNNPDTWSKKSVPTETDNVKIKSGHTITGAEYAIVNALCIEEAGILESPNRQGTSLTLHAKSYLENKGTIRGQAGANEAQEATTCKGDYWNTIGTENCAQPGASLILSVGHDPENLFRNEGIIKAGNGGDGKLHHAYGGNINIYGATIIDSLTETNCGMIKSGDGGSVSNETENVINKLKNIPQRCLDILNELTNISNQYGSVTNESTNVTQISSGRSGKGGNLTLIADYSLYTQGEVIVAAGDGGNCNTEQTQGGNGGNLRFNASKRIDLSGGYFGAGKGSTHCQTNGIPGNSSSDPSVISLSGASTRINGGNITLFGGDDWVLDLSNLSQAAIQATGDITLAVGKDSIIDLRGNKASILEAGGQVNLFADEILLDTGANLHQIITAKNIVVGPSKILYDVALLGAGKYSGEPGTTLSVPLVIANNGPKADTYTLKVDNQKGWALSEISPTVAVKELGIQELSFTVTLPNERGASNLITLTATSQEDLSVTSVATILVTVASQSNTAEQEIVKLPETVVISVPATHLCPDNGQINGLCDNREHTLTNATLGAAASIAGGNLSGVIDNQGLVSQVTIQPDTILTGGRLTGYIVNHGTLKDFNFVGAQVVGGILAGQITNTSQIGGYFQDVNLAAGTQITGGKLAGKITGETSAPAVLEQLEIIDGSRIEHVIIGKGVKLAADVALGGGVQFQDPSQDPRLLTTEQTLTCDTELPLLEVTTHSMQYQAAGGATVNGGLFEPQVTVKLAAEVEVRGVLCATKEVLGKEAEVVVYADYQPLDSTQVQSHYMLDNQREVQPWDRKDEHLVALGSTVIKSKQEVGLYRGVFPVTGKVTLYFGYRLTDGTMVTPAKGIVVNIEP
ncbi:receptor protein kinase-like protein [Thioploca ingrica]|uniref:Receptor protein kinase-like protein n=1 Tax=Thioploca ingrica TaxID=40754 RepID=A0A090BW10_9GAMM|nr:receptor protein kinase-like protein [Thioploca ingrica]